MEMEKILSTIRGRGVTHCCIIIMSLAGEIVFIFQYLIKLFTGDGDAREGDSLPEVEGKYLL